VTIEVIEDFDIVLVSPDGAEEVYRRHVLDFEATAFILAYNQSGGAGRRKAYMRPCRCKWDD
jgi:hypothetical protein